MLNVCLLEISGPNIDCKEQKRIWSRIVNEIYLYTKFHVLDEIISSYRRSNKYCTEMYIDFEDLFHQIIGT